MNIQDIKTIRDIESLPEAILVDRDLDVLHTLVYIGLLESNDGDGTTESETWDRFYEQEYFGLFVLLDESGVDYKAVWGFEGTIPELYKSLDLLWLDGELIE